MDSSAPHPNQAGLEYLESLYAAYLRDPESVPEDWKTYFDAECNGRSESTQREPRPADRAQARRLPGERVRPSGEGATLDQAVLQDRVDQMVRAFRVRGHTVAKIDPLDLPRPDQPELNFTNYGLTEDDLDRVVSCRTIAGPPDQTLRQLLQRLKNTYCRSIGVQFMHIDDLNIRHWLQERMEGTENRISLSRRQQYRIHSCLTEAVIFEEFVQRKFVGAKSFSLEGCESLIPLLDMAIERADQQGVTEIVIGMAHRGRINVMANVLGKRPADIFRGFDDNASEGRPGAGDVRYHLGHSGDYEASSGRKVHLSLCFNPSHLEFINPIALGRMRAKQDRVDDELRRRGMVLLIHGDAAFAGEGVVQESLNLSELSGYFVGGTVHVVVNNQIGFTTPPHQGRSSIYATGVAKMLQIPIFHVNGEDPEAVAQVLHLAMDFRREFHRDVIIDMYGYRRHGHNEMDEPSYTQPVLYQAIRKRPSVREGYLEHLLEHNGVTRDEAEEIASSFKARLEKELSHAQSDDYVPASSTYAGIWAGYAGGPEPDEPEKKTGVDAERLSAILRRTLWCPEGFNRHTKLERFVDQREAMAAGNKLLDWSAAEALALGSLATEGIRIRMSGQDTSRGTFSQRHAVLHDIENGTEHCPLQHLGKGQAKVEIINSPLSEAGVLGFEYGYSLDCPDGLTLWEAQFGDFSNAAQVIIDQFIISAEDKWDRLSGIVLLLPHGFEGQGPEHSSARIERFLTLAAEDNIQVVLPSTPAQYFHALRRQAIRAWRKPLVVFTPKSLLRHPQCKSSLADLAEGAFRRVLPDEQIDPRAARRVLLCAGKIYYELTAARKELERDDVAIVRLEQFYPLKVEPLQAALASYADDTPVLWIQEEPENMGAWRFLKHHIGARLLDRFPLSGVYRPESASPATGWSGIHKREQRQLIEQAFGDGGGAG